MQCSLSVASLIVKLVVLLIFQLAIRNKCHKVHKYFATCSKILTLKKMASVYLLLTDNHPEIHSRHLCDMAAHL